MNKVSSLVLSWRGKVRNANQFWQLAEYESFAAGEVALYAFLVNECNKFHWQMPFSCPTFHVCNRLRMSKQTLVTTRKWPIKYQQSDYNFFKFYFTTLKKFCWLKI